MGEVWYKTIAVVKTKTINGLGLTQCLMVNIFSKVVYSFPFPL